MLYVLSSYYIFSNMGIIKYNSINNIIRKN